MAAPAPRRRARRGRLLHSGRRGARRSRWHNGSGLGHLHCPNPTLTVQGRDATPRGRLVDRVIGYVAPAFLGAGTPALQDAGITTITQVRRLQLVDVARSGPDVRLVARPVRWFPGRRG